MKRFLLIFLILACTATLLVACGKEPEEKELVSLEEIPSGYGIEDAIADGILAHEDGTVVGGEEKWKEFLRKTEDGEPATLRFSRTYNLGDPSRYDSSLYNEIKDDYPMTFVFDLTYDGDSYTVRHFEDGKEYKQEFPYLLRFEGDAPSTATYRHYVRYVLCDRDDVTWEMIEMRLVSSIMSIASISYHEVYSKLS